jgi:predicted O-methyltransferase YrrM
LAEGLNQDGEIHTIDVNEELVDFQRKYFDKSGFGKQIIQHTGNAIEVIPQINKMFDMAFIDADKPNYSNYFHLIIDKINPGGIILSDNVLWHGKVVQPIGEKDVSTKAVINYNTLLKNDKRIETVLLPIRDGLTISRKK